MTTTVSASTTLIGDAATSSKSSSKLVKMANGEYTASSVSSDPTDATKLGLVKEKDGNYGTAKPTIEAAKSAAASSPAGVQSALLSLKLGGA